jgi:antitoxin ParD1/3/4
LNHICILIYTSIYLLAVFLVLHNGRVIGGVGVKLITLYLPEPYIKALDGLVSERYYPNRAEAIRVAVRDLLKVEAWRKKA